MFSRKEHLFVCKHKVGTWRYIDSSWKGQVALPSGIFSLGLVYCVEERVTKTSDKGLDKQEVLFIRFLASIRLGIFFLFPW